MAMDFNVGIVKPMAKFRHIATIETQIHGNSCCLTRTLGHGRGLLLYKSVGIINAYDNVRPMAMDFYFGMAKFRPMAIITLKPMAMAIAKQGPIYGHGRALSL